MEVSRINQILMHMGGSRCRMTHLLKNGFSSASEIEELIEQGYFIKEAEAEDIYIQKTEKAKRLW